MDATPFCIAYNKPCGMICTIAKQKSKKEKHFDQKNQVHTLADISHEMPEGFHPIGRLDRHSHGLLLFSIDGRLTSALLSPRTCVPRVYEIVVRGDIGCEDDKRYQEIKEKVKNGVHTDYGFFDGVILGMRRDVRKDGYAHQHCKDDSGATRNDKYGLSPEEFDHYQKSKSTSFDSKCNIETDDNDKVLSSIKVLVKEGKKRMV